MVSSKGPWSKMREITVMTNHIREGDGYYQNKKTVAISGYCLITKDYGRFLCIHTHQAR